MSSVYKFGITAAVRDNWRAMICSTVGADCIMDQNRFSLPVICYRHKCATRPRRCMRFVVKRMI
jgi:hypothetical protein